MATSFTLGTASQATGMAKSSILRAIKVGRLSAVRNEDGTTWNIDPSELARVFPLLAVPGAPVQQPRSEHDALADTLVAELRVMLLETRAERDRWHAAHEKAQQALAETLAALQRQLPPPIEQGAMAVEAAATPDATGVEQPATPVEPPKRRRWWKRAAIL